MLGRVGSDDDGASCSPSSRRATARYVARDGEIGPRLRPARRRAASVATWSGRRPTTSSRRPTCRAACRAPATPTSRRSSASGRSRRSSRLLERLPDDVEVAFDPGEIYARRGVKRFIPFLKRASFLFATETRARALCGMPARRGDRASCSTSASASSSARWAAAARASSAGGSTCTCRRTRPRSSTSPAPATCSRPASSAACSRASASRRPAAWPPGRASRGIAGVGRSTYPDAAAWRERVAEERGDDGAAARRSADAREDRLALDRPRRGRAATCSPTSSRRAERDELAARHRRRVLRPRAAARAPRATASSTSSPRPRPRRRHAVERRELAALAERRDDLARPAQPRGPRGLARGTSTTRSCELLEPSTLDVLVLAGYMLIISPAMCAPLRRCSTCTRRCPAGRPGTWQEVIWELLRRRRRRDRRDDPPRHRRARPRAGRRLRLVSHRRAATGTALWQAFRQKRDALGLDGRRRRRGRGRAALRRDPPPRRARARSRCSTRRCGSSSLGTCARARARSSSVTTARAAARPHAMTVERRARGARTSQRSPS